MSSASCAFLNLTFIILILLVCYLNMNNSAFFKIGWSDSFKFYGLVINSPEKYFVFISILILDKIFYIYRTLAVWVFCYLNLAGNIRHTKTK